MMSRRLLLPVLIISMVAVSWTSARATTILLSSDSNDPSIDAALLDATLQFELTAPTTLTLTVTNDAVIFDMVAVFFNAPSTVTNLSLSSGPKDWKLEDSTKKGHPTEAGVFGTFDYVVWVKGKKAKNEKLAPGESGVFVVDISGTGPFAATDFTAGLSDVGPGEVSAFTAATFVLGKDEVVGAFHTPEPDSSMLLGLGLVGLALTRGKRSHRFRH